MRLSYQIPLITGLAIIATICVNIVAFHYFMDTLFLAYTSEIQTIEQKGSLSPEKLSTILDVSTLSPEKQDEYKEVVTELGIISNSLKNISDNPELYLQAGIGSTENRNGNHIFPISLVKKTEKPFASITSLLANPTGWDQDSPEGRLVIGLLTRLSITNLIFLCIITTLYFLWIRRVFFPVHLIIDRLNLYIDSARFQSIYYRQSDEFAPLVATINNLYKSLRVQENIRSNFLSDISHEIRTPITAVRCYLEAIEDGVMKLENKTIPLLQTELSRLTSIAEKIMEYEHLTNRSTEDIHVETFSIKEQIETIIYEYTPQLEKSRQTIHLINHDDTVLRMDKNMFIQILHNIFSNFIKYSGTGTDLMCSYETVKNHIRIIFADNGIGIPEEEINLVTEKFYRIDKSRTHDIGMSMGIGLSIVDHIIRIHDGSMTIANNHSTRGLSITLLLPR